MFPPSLCLRGSPDKSTGVGCHFLLQGVFPIRARTQVSRIAGRLFTTEPPGKPPEKTTVINLGMKTTLRDNELIGTHGRSVRWSL